MKRKNIYKFYVFLLIIVVLTSSFFVNKYFVKNNQITSPLPDFLTSFSNNQVSTLNLWTPMLGIFEPKTIEIPEISAKSALAYDLNNQKVLFSKNPTKQLPMASLTKIMTAIVALEAPEKDEYIVTEDNLVGENSMGLSPGEKLTLMDLLYGLILLSGNDAAETLAGNFEGGRTEFIAAMNNKARSLGLQNTRFTNPSGLEGDGRQYTTAHDLLVMANYAMQNPVFKKVAGTFIYNISYTQKHKAFYLQNETNLISSYPGVMGIKDGYTPEAGLCLVTYLNYKNHKIIGIILGSDNRRQEMKDLLDYSLKLQGINPPPHG